MPTVTRAAIRCFGRSCKVAVPDRAARRVVPRVPCKSNLQALVSQGFRLERREPFCMRIPLQASLRDASSPKGGAYSTAISFYHSSDTFPLSQKSSPFGGAGCDQREQTERVRGPTSPLFFIKPSAILRMALFFDPFPRFYPLWRCILHGTDPDGQADHSGGQRQI